MNDIVNIINNNVMIIWDYAKVSQISSKQNINFPWNSLLRISYHMNCDQTVLYRLEKALLYHENICFVIAKFVGNE